MSDLESYFDNLRGNYRIASPQTPRYNCIAFAAGDDRRWWWPHPHPMVYWPPSVPREETVEAFMAAFAALGYFPCEHGQVEDGFEKVAIYADEHGTPTHMARQLASGQWISKCGALEDIEHDTLEAVGGRPNGYGSVIQFLKRPSRP